MGRRLRKILEISSSERSLYSGTSGQCFPMMFSTFFSTQKTRRELKKFWGCLMNTRSQFSRFSILMCVEECTVPSASTKHKCSSLNSARKPWDLNQALRKQKGMGSTINGPTFFTKLYLCTPTRTRTWNQRLKRPMLYQLSYGGYNPSSCNLFNTSFCCFVKVLGTCTSKRTCKSPLPRPPK